MNVELSEMTRHALYRANLLHGLRALMIASVLITTCIFAIELLGYRANPVVVSSKINRSIFEHTSSFPAEWAKNTATGVDTHTDCLTLLIATHMPNTIREKIVSALYDTGPGDHICAGVTDRLGTFQAASKVADYWRYWWGSASLLATVLDADGTTLPGYQAALKYGTYLVLGLIAIASLVRFKGDGLLVLPVTFALAFGYGIPLFGQSIAHAPGLLMGLALLLCYVVVNPLHLGLLRRAVFAGVAGGITFYFDLLNGNLIAVLLLLGIVNIASMRRQAAATPWPITASTLVLIVSYVAGAAYVLLLRWVFRALMLKQGMAGVITEWLHDLSLRTRNSVPDYGEFDIGPIYILKRLFQNLDYAFVPYLSQRAAVVVYMIGGLLFAGSVLWIAARAYKGISVPKDAIASISIITVLVPVWFLVFANHTVVHSWMTGRLLSLFFAFSLSLIILLCENRNSRHDSHDSRLTGSMALAKTKNLRAAA